MDVPINEAYESFIYKNELSFSSFYKYCEDKYKKPHRLTDLCEYCEIGLKLKKKISEIIIEYNYYSEYDIFEISSLIKLIRKIKNNNITIRSDQTCLDTTENVPKDLISCHLKDAKDYQEYEFHKTIALKQREIYKNQKTNKLLLKDNILIEMDFKQKIIIGQGPRQVNAQYYDNRKRTFLGKKK